MNETRKVSLNNKIEGPDASARAKIMEGRSLHLPDPSVELLYPSVVDDAEVDNQKEGKSRHFTVRTTEKEPELVQTTLDLLLRREGEGDLLKKVFVRSTPVVNREARLYFFKEEPPAKLDYEKDREEIAKIAGNASPSFVKTLTAASSAERWASRTPPSRFLTWWKSTARATANLTALIR